MDIIICFIHRYKNSVTGLETYHLHLLRTMQMLSSHLYCTKRKDGSYAPVFQSEGFGTITPKKSSLVLLNGILMLETKG